MDSFALENTDVALLGMTDSWLGLVQGPAASGKSALLDRLCLEALKSDQEVWYFCLDPDGPERRERLAAQLNRPLPDDFCVLAQDALRDVEFFRWLDEAPDGSLVLIDSLAGVHASAGGPSHLLRHLASVQNQRALRVLASVPTRRGPRAPSNQADFVIETDLERGQADSHPGNQVNQANQVKAQLIKNRFGDTAQDRFPFELTLPGPPRFDWRSLFPRERLSPLAE